VLVEGYNPWSRLQATKKGDLTSADPDSVACLNKEKPLTQVQEDGSYTGHWPTTGNEASEPIEIAVEPPEHALLKRAPSERQLLATLTEAFGDVEILSVAANDRPATDYKTTRGRTIDLTGGEKPEGKQAVRDLRQALGELIDHTCRSGTERCTADQKCGRHTRRRRAV